MKRLCRKKLTGWRLHKNLSMQQLADEMTRAGHPITKAAISAFEKGITRPLPETINQLAHALEIDPDELSESDFDLDFVVFHECETMQPAMRRAIQAKIEWLAHRREKLYELSGISRPSWELNPFAISSLKETYKLADQVRESLGLDTAGEIHFAKAIELKGIQVLELDDSPKFHGAAARSSNGVPFLIIQRGKQEYYSHRFELARELALLLLDPASPVDAKAFAQSFAGELTLPSEFVIEKLGKRILAVDFQLLGKLRKQYRIPLEIWLRRAYDCGVIRDSVYRSSVQRLSQVERRADKWEPKPLPERSSIDLRLAATAFAKGTMSSEEVRTWVGVPGEKLKQLHGLNP